MSQPQPLSPAVSILTLPVSTPARPSPTVSTLVTTSTPHVGATSAVLTPGVTPPTPVQPPPVVPAQPAAALQQVVATVHVSSLPAVLGVSPNLEITRPQLTPLYA